MREGGRDRRKEGNIKTLLPLSLLRGDHMCVLLR